MSLWVLHETTLSGIATLCSFFVTESGLSEHTDVVKITVWMQSTLPRLTVSLYAVNSSTSKDELKLTVDMEDIMTSLDLQPVYLKVKCKVAYAGILHYIR
jgi:hypothetical protein